MHWPACWKRRGNSRVDVDFAGGRDRLAGNYSAQRSLSLDRVQVMPFFV